MKEILDFIIAKPSEAAVIIAGMALILSSISTIAAVIAVFLQRSHNRRSVRPLADILLSDYENRLAVAVLNNGMGPLLIECLEVSLDGKVQNKDVIDLMPKTPPNIDWWTFVKNLSGRVLSPGERRVVIELRGDESDSNFILFRDKVRNALTSLHLKLRYKDVYGKQMPFCERSLGWFGRSKKVEGTFEDREPPTKQSS